MPSDRTLQKLPWQSWDFFTAYPYSEMSWSDLQTEIQPQKQTKPSNEMRILAILGHIDQEKRSKLAKKTIN